MGNCGGKAYSGHHKVAAEHQAAMNEAAVVVEKQIQNDVERDVKRVEEAAAEAMNETKEEEVSPTSDETGEEEEARIARLREAQASLKKATRRLNKLDALKDAKHCGALDQDDYNAAVRRLTAITGIDPTSDRKHSLPEGCEWLTSLLDCLWPSIRSYTKKLMHDTIQPIINAECKKYGVSCVIKKFDLGSNNPAFGPIEGRYVGPNASKDSLEISIGVTVHSNMCVSMTTTAGDVGIQNYSFAGKLFLTLKSFLDKPPFVGAVEVAFANPPRLDLDWTGVVGFFSSVQPVIVKAVNDFIADFCVLPNRRVFPLVSNNPKVDIAKLARPAPEGVLRLTVVSCLHCPSKPMNPKSSVRIKVGAQTWNTKETTVLPDGSLWLNESTNFLIFNRDQWVIMELLEGATGDDVVGEILNIPANRLVKRREATIPFTKLMFPVTDDRGVASTITVKAQWLRLNNSVTDSSDGALCSVEIGEVGGIPKAMASRGPFRVSGTAGQAPRISPAGGTKPGTSTTPKELLRLIRSHPDEKPIQIAKIHQMQREGDLQLIKQALARQQGEYIIQAPEEHVAEWQTESYLLDFQVSEAKLIQDWKDEGVKSSAIEERKKWYLNFASYVTWTEAVEETRRHYHEANDPYIGSAIHLWCSKVDNVTLKLLDKENLTVAEGIIPVTDNVTGDGADVVGPFKLSLKHSTGNETSVQVSGQIVIQSLEATDILPENWCLEADALVAKDEFTEWWQHEVYVADWLDWKTLKETHMDTESMGSKLQPVGEIGKMWMSSNWPDGDKTLATRETILERDSFYRDGVTKTGPVGPAEEQAREASLRVCLDAGALTWGDYDVLVGKLNGESNANTIAETLEWLNMIISATWPGVVKYTANQLKNNIEPEINSSISSYGASAKFTKVSLGSKEPAFGTIQCRELRKINKRTGEEIIEGCELIFNDMSFVSQIDIQLEATVLGKTVSGGIKNLHFKGSVIVTLKPVLSEPVPPFFGAVEVTLRNPPMLELMFTGDVGKAFDGVASAVSNFKSTFNDSVIQSISESCVIPNTIVVPLSNHPSVDMAHLSCPRPVGVIRLTISECLHLTAADKSKSLTGEVTSNSDAYVIIKLGNQVVRSEQVTSLNPRFNFTTDLVVYHEEQAVDIEVWDNNRLMPDVSLGAVFHKGTVLGGGTDEIKRGIPVRGLRALRKGTLDLQVKELDSLLTTRSNLVYTLNNAIGESQCPSVVVVETEWLTEKESLPTSDNINKSFIMSACVRSAEGIRTSSGKPEGPYTIRVSAGGQSVTTKHGDGNSGCLGAKDLLATVTETLSNSADEEEAFLKISKSTHISKVLAKEALALPVNSLTDADLEKVKQWHFRCSAAIASYRQHASPDFNQVVHAAFKSSRDSDIAGGAWSCPVLIELVGKNGKTICSAEKHVAVSSISDPAIKGTLSLTGDGSCRLRCEISLTGLKGNTFNPLELSEDEEILGLTAFTGPEYITTPHGTQPKIGEYVVARNLTKMIELNWKVTNKKKGEPIRRGDHPQPEGKVVGWTQDGSRAVVDFGNVWGEWNVRPRNLCLAPPPLPPPPPPNAFHMVCPEIFSCEGEYLLSHKKARNQPVWRLEGVGDNSFTMKIYSDEDGRWVCAPEGCEPYLKTVQPHEGRYPHMMRHSIESNVEMSSVSQPLESGIVWQIQNNVWEDSVETKCQIEKPIAEEHEEVIDEMIDDVMDDIAADLEADLLEDLEQELADEVENDVAEELGDDMEVLLDEQSFGDDDEDELAALAAQEAERLDAERQAEEDREAERLEAERAAQEAAEAERAAQEAERAAQEAERVAQEAEARRLEEEQQKLAAEEAERQARIEAERKMKEDERKEAERKRLEEEEKKRKEAEEKAKAEADKKKKADEEAKKKAEEAKKKAEEEKKRREAEEKKKREEAEKKKKAAAEAARRKREEEERKRKEEEERRKREEARKKKAEEDRQKAEAARKARKAANRKGKMETLNKALEIGAISKPDFATALRRLQAVTGEDPTNEGRSYTLPETMQWLSTTLSVLWPHIKVLLTNELQNICTAALEKVSKDVSMGTLDLGKETPGFGPVSVKYLEDDIEVGLGINYLSNVDITFTTESGTVVVQKLKCVGTMYFWLRHFMDKWPFIGGLQCAFVNPPTMKFVFDKTNPHRKSQMTVQMALSEALKKSCVVPNFVTMPFGGGGMEYFATPKPQGVVKITVLKCNDLEALDAGFNPSSDPYVIVSVGTKTKQTDHILENLDPVWTSNNEFKFLVYNPDQWVLFDVYDYDEDDGDDYVGGVVGLPINRLVIRCLENPDGITIPITKDGKPVQGESGENSTITIKAEWLTIDSNTSTEESSLVRIELEDLSELPPQLSGPFRVKASSGGDVAVSRHSATHTAVKSSADILSSILKMSAAGRTSSFISKVLSFPLHLVKDAVNTGKCSFGASALSIASADLAPEGGYSEWFVSADGFLTNQSNNEKPQFLDNMYLNLPTLGSHLRLEVLDGNDTVIGHCTVALNDDAVGEEADVVGPFEIQIPSARATASINADITVQSLRREGLPKSWNTRSKNHKAMGDKRKLKGNEEQIKKNAGGKLTNEKETALNDCLKAGALTWGDYDILVGKLRGEGDGFSIAETLEWVNMIINKVWPHYRKYLEKRMNQSLDEQLQSAIASLPGASVAGLSLSLAKPTSLGAKAPSFSTINAEKITTHHGYRGLKLTFNNVQFNSNIEVDLIGKAAGVEVSVSGKDVKLQSTMCVEMSHFSEAIPFIGYLEAYFPNPPQIDLSLSVAGFGNLGSLCSYVAGRAISDVMVLPNTANSYFGASSQTEGAEQSNKIKPVTGVLRLSVIRAKSLVAGDVAVAMLRSENSDSYVSIKLGIQNRRTKIIKSLDPEWHEQFDLVVRDMSQWLDLEVFDSDLVGKDDSLGTILHKETVLGGGTDLICRGIPISALCQKMWSPDNRNREYFSLPLSQRVVDEDLSIKDGPYVGARVEFTGGGKYKANEPLVSENFTIPVGDSGVVESVDKTTKPFHSFICSFNSGDEPVTVHALDLKVSQPKIVWKMIPSIGQDGNESKIHIHGEWLSPDGAGSAVAQLVKVNAINITGSPLPSERDLGLPYTLKFTSQVVRNGTVGSEEDWKSLTTNPSGASVNSTVSLPNMLKTLDTMWSESSESDIQKINSIASCLSITSEHVQQGIDLSDSNHIEVPQNTESKTITIIPLNKNNRKKYNFTMYESESEKDARRRLRATLLVQKGFVLSLKQDGKDLPHFEYQNVTGSELHYSSNVTQDSSYWISSVRSHINSVRAAECPTFNETLTMTSPSAEVPHILIEVLNNKSVVLGSSKVIPTSSGIYPEGPYDVEVKQEAAGGMFGFGKTEGYDYNFEVNCDFTTKLLKAKT